MGRRGERVRLHEQGGKKRLHVTVDAGDQRDMHSRRDRQQPHQ